MSLALLLAIAVVLILLSLFVQAFILWIAARLCRIPATTYRRALGTCLVITLLTAAIGTGGFVAERSLQEGWPGGPEGGASRLLLVLSVTLLATGLLLPWLLVKWFLRASWGKAFLATLLMIVLGNSFAVGLAFAIRWTLLEAFVIPAGSMATAIYGPHSQMTCPNCGCGYAVGMSDQLGPGRWQDLGPVATACPNCGLPGQVPADAEILQGDRVLVEKLNTPRRWDLVVFEYPEDPSINFIKRLVGLPRETVQLAGGEVYIDGQLQAKPPGMVRDLWFFVHDTGHVAKQEVSEGPQWRPADPASNWRQAAGTWSCQNPDGEADLLRFSGTLDDRVAYNGVPDERPMAWPGEEPFPPLVGDVKIECLIDHFSGDGQLGFVWEFRGRPVEATLSAGGEVEIVEHLLSDPGPDDEPNRSEGRLARGLAEGPRLAFAVRDGQAYVMEGDTLVALLLVGPQDVDSLDDDASQPPEPCRVEIVAEGCSVTLAEIRLSRDVYYRPLDQTPGSGMDPGATLGGDRIRLGPGEHFVLGDNTTRSKDSRFWGAVKSDALIGVARWIYWPLDRWHEFR